MTKFSDFIRNASSEERTQVYGRVIKAASEQQNKTIAAAKPQPQDDAELRKRAETFLASIRLDRLDRSATLDGIVIDAMLAFAKQYAAEGAAEQRKRDAQICEVERSRLRLVANIANKEGRHVTANHLYGKSDEAKLLAEAIEQQK